MNILVTGGAGYIGSHTSVLAMQKKYNVVIFDNLINSGIEVISKITKLVGQNVEFVNGDLLNYNLIFQTLKKFKIDIVMHFAALKSVEESIRKPIHYYENNVQGTINLLRAMENLSIFNFIFSSSASVYGAPKKVPIKENLNLQPINPYGNSKLFIEIILKNLSTSNNNWKIICLRYFNPIGSHHSGLLGDKPKGEVKNLLPVLVNSINSDKVFNVFGNNYSTRDGTGIRDYIHIMDLVEGHILCLDYLKKKFSFEIFNLGTGNGYTVLEIIENLERVFNCKIKYQIKPPRQGDVDQCFADITRAEKVLGWKAKRNLLEMCESIYNFNKKQLRINGN